MESNVNFSTHLHSVVAHFAELGPEARRYLLKMRTLGRLLRTLLAMQNISEVTKEPHDEAEALNQLMPLIQVVKASKSIDGENDIYLTPGPACNLNSRLLQKERMKLS